MIESYRTKVADTKEEIKRQTKIRTDLNDQLMQVLTGKSSVVPEYVFTNLPKCPNDEYRPEDGSADELVRVVRDLTHNQGFKDAGRRVALREMGVVVPDNVPIRELLEKYKEQAAVYTQQVVEHVRAGGCLYYYFPFRNLLALNNHL